MTDNEYFRFRARALREALEEALVLAENNPAKVCDWLNDSIGADDEREDGRRSHIHENAELVQCSTCMCRFKPGEYCEAEACSLKHIHDERQATSSLTSKEP